MKNNWVIISLFIAAALPAAAQNPSDKNREARAVAGTAVSDPGLQSTAAQSKSQLSLISSNEGETQVRAEIGYLRSKVKVDWIYALRITSPITKGAQETKLASLTGLGSGAKAGLHLTRIGYGRNYDPDAVVGVCRQHDKEFVRDYGPPPRIDVNRECTIDGIRGAFARWAAPPKIKNAAMEEFESALLVAAAAACEAYNKSGEGPLIDCEGRRQPKLAAAQRRANVVQDLIAADGRIAAERARRGDPPRPPGETWEAKVNDETKSALKEFCQTLNTDPSKWGLLLGKSGCDSDDLARAGAEWESRAEQAVRLKPTFLSFAFELQNQTYKFTPGATLDETKETHQNLSVSTSFGRLFVGPEWYIGVTGAVERAYQGGTPEQICGPIADTNLTTCKTIARTAPTHDDNEIVSIEARHLITDSIAIQPRISHDFADDINAAEVTFYLLTHKEKGLNGGVRLGYREDDEQPSVVVFIGVPFNLFGD